MQTEYVYPALGNRMSPKEWVEPVSASVTSRAAQHDQQVIEHVRRLGGQPGAVAA
jgi:trimethylamine---corrinoid protein Co-methyltransferase